MRRISAYGYWRLVVAFAVLFAAAPLAPVLAQDVVENAAPAAIPGLTVAENAAAADFPEGITFSIEAETDDPIANVELMYRPTGTETYSVELPAFNEGATSLSIDQAIDAGPGGASELPVGIDVEYHWRITEADADVVETPEQTVSWTDDRFAWTKLEGPHVAIYSYDADPAFQQEILDSAERTVESLLESYGAELDQQIRIWVYANKEDFYGTQAPFAEPWAAGGSYSDFHMIVAILPPGDHREVARIVPHEISHQVLDQATDHPVGIPPGWLDEGLAEYSQESGREPFYQHALALAAEGRVPSLRTMNSPSPYWPYDRGDATALYAFSLSAVMYIVDTWGEEGVSKLIEAVAEGVTPETAVQQGLGISFDELDRQWQEDLIADAKQVGATGTTRFGDDNDASPWGSIGEGIALASGTLILGLVVLIALIAGLFALVRSRRRHDPDEPIEGVRWGEWPEGLELPRALRES